MRRRWVQVLAVVVVLVSLPVFLLWLALVDGKIWPFNDRYYDPHTEISKSYHRHPDAFHHVAYHVLTHAQQQPDALLGEMTARVGTPKWHLNKVDERHGEPVQKYSPRSAVQITPDFPGIPGGRYAVVSWQHTNPDCVFFFYGPNIREDREKIDVLRPRWSVIPPTSVVLAYHPAHKPPRRFIDDSPLPVTQRGNFSEKRKQDPLYLGPRPKWKGKSINKNWTVFTS